MDKWSKKVAVVTGASSGIGAQIVKDFSKAGIHTIGLARRVARVEEIAEICKNFPGKVYARECDVSNIESIKSAFKSIENEFGSISILVNNAGIVQKTSILDDSDEATEKLIRVIDTNFTGAIHCSREAFRLMKKSDDFGMIININTVLADTLPYGTHFLNIYAPTKLALKASSEIIRQELISMQNSKIRVASISPGLVKTDSLSNNDMMPNEAVEEFYVQRSVLDCSDVANTVLFVLNTPTHVNITDLVMRSVLENL